MRNGAPADRPLLQSFADFLAFRGPDGQQTWADGPVGLGHTLLRTTYESMGERQPASLEGQLWITADARLDCRGGTRSRTQAGGTQDSDGSAGFRIDPACICCLGRDVRPAPKGRFCFRHLG